MTIQNEHWPRLPLEQWKDTYETLHLWSQIVGKIRLSRMPWINHSWHVPLYVTAHGLTTSLIPYGIRSFEIDFDFIDHRLHIVTSGGERRSFTLKPMSVATFYQKMMGVLSELDIEVSIWPMPVEIPDPILPFHENEEQAAYDSEAVERFWRALLQVHRVFTDFRVRFIGKVSPVHFFWGAFDLAVTRFSGRTAPKHPGGVPNCADWIMQEAYSHEVSSAGFWPGAGLGEAAFYAYAYPEPNGFSEYPVLPDAAYYHKDLREFIIPYEAVRTAKEPDTILSDFLQSTYEAAADLAGWDRSTLERKTDPTGK
ncbi:MAG: hypothetical protein C4583_07625 [Anaerolineaceae bacterium]|nr:MAG: hypothetical protein C4583_07625 [Anaerolineaceae bacterium]